MNKCFSFSWLLEMSRIESTWVFVIFLCVFPCGLRAGISRPSFGNRTYVDKESNVTLDWTYDFNAGDVLLTRWFFINDFKVKEEVARLQVGSVTILNSSLPNTGVIKPASLVLSNVSLVYNGTYRIEISITGPVSLAASETEVIVKVQPVANITCNSSVALDEGDDFLCICNGTAGNPPPSASWQKNNEIIETVGYRIKILNITRVKKTDNGTYVCRTQSHTLVDERPVEVCVSYKPSDVMLISNVADNIVQLGGSVNLTCIADSNPKPNYHFFFNGTKVGNNTDGVFSIANASYINNGTYTCRASNRLGSAEMNLSVVVVEELPSTRPTTAETSPNVSTETPIKTSTKAPTGTKKKKTSGTKTGLIVGIVVGVLVIMVLIVAIWWRFFRGSRRGKERQHVVQRSESGASRSADIPPRGENPYESVEGYKENESAEDGGAGSSVNNPPTDNPGSSMPPVYAVVDKSKKKPKKEDALTYASLDPVALQPDSSKMRVRDHKATNYAEIDPDKLKKNDV